MFFRVSLKCGHLNDTVTPQLQGLVKSLSRPRKYLFIKTLADRKHTNKYNMYCSPNSVTGR